MTVHHIVSKLGTKHDDLHEHSSRHCPWRHNELNLWSWYSTVAPIPLFDQQHQQDNISCQREQGRGSVQGYDRVRITASSRVLGVPIGRDRIRDVGARREKDDGGESVIGSHGSGDATVERGGAVEVQH